MLKPFFCHWGFRVHRDLGNSLGVVSYDCEEWSLVLFLPSSLVVRKFQVSLLSKLTLSPCWHHCLRSGQTLAVDVYSSYFFFSLTSRLPLVTLLVSALSLAVFLICVAWKAWPAAVLVLSFGTGILFCLQFLVYGVHRAALGAAWMIRTMWGALTFVGWRVRSLVSRAATRAEGAEESRDGEAATAEPAGVVVLPMENM